MSRRVSKCYHDGLRYHMTTTVYRNNHPRSHGGFVPVASNINFVSPGPFERAAVSTFSPTIRFTFEPTAECLGVCPGPYRDHRVANWRAGRSFFHLHADTNSGVVQARSAPGLAACRQKNEHDCRPGVVNGPRVRCLDEAGSHRRKFSTVNRQLLPFLTRRPRFDRTFFAWPQRPRTRQRVSESSISFRAAHVRGVFAVCRLGTLAELSDARAGRVASARSRIFPLRPRDSRARRDRMPMEQKQ